MIRALFTCIVFFYSELPSFRLSKVLSVRLSGLASVLLAVLILCFSAVFHIYSSPRGQGALVQGPDEFSNMEFVRQR